MKKYLNPELLPLCALGAGMLGMLLQLWQYVGGREESGLLVTGHPAGILAASLSLLTLAFLLWQVRAVEKDVQYHHDYPASVLGCVGAAVAALAVLWTAVTDLREGKERLFQIAGVLGLLAGVSLCVLGLCRLRGRRPEPMLQAGIAVYFMARLICQYRGWSGDPQILTYCYPLLATVGVLLACFQNAAFGSEAGKRRRNVFFHLTAVYFCCLSLVGDHAPLFYLAMLIWMLTDLCRLTPVRERGQNR